MEDGNRCDSREYIGGCALQQAVNCPTAGAVPKPSAMHSFCQEHFQIGQEQ
jgi:hypothetical protein